MTWKIRRTRRVLVDLRGAFDQNADTDLQTPVYSFGIEIRTVGATGVEQLDNFVNSSTFELNS